jgi:hypothetical protein
MSNAIYSIRPSWQDGVLAFDDEARGLRREPFVAGADDALAVLAGGRQEFTVLFSDGEFPGAQVRVDRREAEYGGNWYETADGSLRGWLCPALYRYYAVAPDSLWIEIRD